MSSNFFTNNTISVSDELDVAKFFREKSIEYENQRNYPKALEYALKSNSIFEKYNDITENLFSVAYSENQVAVYLSLCKNYRDALKYYSKSYETYKKFISTSKEPNYKILSNIKYDMAEICDVLGENEHAINNYLLALHWIIDKYDNVKQDSAEIVFNSINSLVSYYNKNYQFNIEKELFSTYEFFKRTGAYEYLHYAAVCAVNLGTICAKKHTGISSALQTLADYKEYRKNFNDNNSYKDSYYDRVSIDICSGNLNMILNQTKRAIFDFSLALDNMDKAIISSPEYVDCYKKYINTMKKHFANYENNDSIVWFDYKSKIAKCENLLHKFEEDMII